MLKSGTRLLIAVETFFLTLIFFTSLISAQQYEGDVIANALPAVDGSEIAFFKIHDSAGLTATATNYYSLNSSGGQLAPFEIKRAVIFLHGLQRDPHTYIKYMLDALAAVPSNQGVTADNVAIICPYFPNGADKTTGYPWTDGLSAGEGSTSNALVWSSSNWASGGDAQYPAYPVDVANISSYDVLDQMIQYFDNKTIFPNMNSIVVGGHSLGAQMIQRYAAVGDVLDTVTTVSYYVANPGTLLWFTEDRPLSTTSCSDYDDWRSGLTDYTSRYGHKLVKKKGRSAVLTRYNTRQIAYARGTEDWGDDSDTCGEYTTGVNRGERFFNFINTFTPTCSGVFGSCSTIDYVEASHEAEVMMVSAAGQARIFLDNFNGTGEMAYDFGTRIQPNDDPFPNPAISATPEVIDSVSGVMTYAGCWTDSSTPPHYLSYQAYSGSSNLTIEDCTSTCNDLGFTAAGLLFAEDCFCDDAIGADSLQQADGVCGSTCTGDSSELCGALNRFSVYSAGTLQQNGPLIQPAQIGNYSFLQCQIDDTTNRALTGITETQGAMTLSECADFCEGYTYFGTEYANECFCGNSLAVTSSSGDLSSCNMACSANGTEICGGSFRLSIYELSITCDDNQGDGIIFTAANNGTYQISCNTDHYAGDLSSFVADSMNACMDACDTTDGCIDVSWDADQTCYLKSSLTGAFTADGVINALKLS